MYGVNSYSFAFYIHAPVHYWERDDIKRAKEPLLVFMPRHYLDSLAADGVAAEPLQHFAHFHISQLTGGFISYNTRAANTEDFVLARVRPLLRNR